MFKVGDIVKIKSGYYLGIKYTFKIVLVEEALNPACFNVYRIARNKQQKLDPVYGPYDYQLKIIDEIENRIWKEYELKLVGTTLETKIKIEDKELFDRCVQGITIQKDSCQDTTVKLSDEVMKWDKVSIPTSLTYAPYSQQCKLKTTKIKIDKINKEGNNMDILRLYEERKGEEIANNYLKEREKILKEDEIQSIIIEMENQVNTILENQNLRSRLKVNSEELFTAETEIKLEELRNRIDAERKKLRSTLEEIRALFEMTDSYEEKIKILKNYGIVGDNGRINA